LWDWLSAASASALDAAPLKVAPTVTCQVVPMLWPDR